MLDALGIDPAWLPPTFEGPAVTGAITAAAAAATGLRAGTPVDGRRRRPGGQRGRAWAPWRPGRVALSLGTSGVVFATTDSPLFEPAGRVHAFCHAVPGRWHMMSVMLSAAGSLRWFRDAVAPGVPFGDAGRRGVARPPAGSDGLLFLPYLSGERSPHPDPLARGAFVGLTLAHDRRHLARAVLEGVAFGLRDGLDLMIAAGMPAPAQIRASGGGTASALWRQILADVLQAEIATVSTTEGAAYGAALLAARRGRLVPDGRGGRRRRRGRDAGRGAGSATRARTPTLHARVPRAVSGARAVVPAPGGSDAPRAAVDAGAA